jgi:hypothetical protein
MGITGEGVSIEAEKKICHECHWSDRRMGPDVEFREDANDEVC